jgi:hypothetical protein
VDDEDEVEIIPSSSFVSVAPDTIPSTEDVVSALARLFRENIY